jgi:hypothetical protein
VYETVEGDDDEEGVEEIKAFFIPSGYQHLYHCSG